MPYTNTGKNTMLDNIGITHAAAFEGDPSGAGVELDRQAISFAAASGGSKAASTQPVFSIGAGETVDYIGFYDDPSAGNLLAYGSVTSEGPYGGDGTYTLTSAAIDLNG
jgi:hypothetical protein